MKKYMIGTLALLLTLTGCSFSDANATVKNAKETAMTVGSYTVSNDDLYYMLSGMLTQGSDSSVYNIMIENVVNKVETAIIEEKVPVTDEITAEAQELVDSYKESYGSIFSYLLAMNGYADEEEFLTKVAIPQAQYSKFVKMYVEEKVSTMLTVYKPRKVELADFADSETAAKVLEELKAGKKLADIASEATNYKGEEQIILSNSSLDTVILSSIMSLTENGVVASVIPASDGTFYVVNAIEVNGENFQDEAIDAIVNGVNLREDAIRSALKSKNFGIYDKHLYDLFKEYYSDYIID